MGFADTFSADDALAFADAFGETVTYTPASGPVQTVTDAIVIRGVMDKVQQSQGGAVRHVVHLSRSTVTTQPARGCKLTFADVYGGTATVHADVQIDQFQTDPVYWVLRAR